MAVKEKTARVGNSPRPRLINPTPVPGYRPLPPLAFRRQLFPLLSELSAPLACAW